MSGSRPAQCQVRNNTLIGLGGIFVDADQSTVSGNTVPSRETFSGSGFSVVVSGPQCVVSDNSAYAGILVGLSGTDYQDCVVSGNSVLGELFCRPGASAVSGNRVNGILTVQQGTTAIDFYEENLHPSSEAEQLPCSARSIIYCPTVMAGLIASQIKAYAMGEPTRQEIVIDLVNVVLNAHDTVRA